MKKIFIILIFVLLSANAHAITAIAAVTKTGYVACISEQYLDDIVQFKRERDRQRGEQYIMSKKCVVPKRGLVVTVEDTSKEGKTQFDYNGFKLWTITDALDVSE
jgi:hypothetical protein